MVQPLSEAEFQRLTNVSRETMDDLASYAQLLRKWQAKINLVGPSTMDDIWRRHFLDSLQLVHHAPESFRNWLDFGSGAGFPGMIVALATRESGGRVHLVESNGKKCSFLREVARSLGLDVDIHQGRLEKLSAFRADVISARACARLEKLLEMSQPFCDPDSLFLFPKGQDVDEELTETTKYWSMTVNKLPSLSDSEGSLLQIRNLHRAK